MDTHGGVPDLLGAWALGACDDDEVARVEGHLGACMSCTAEAARMRAAAGWLAIERVEHPPVALRDRILTAARQRRAPSTLGALTEAYAAQVKRLDDVLRGLTAGDWQRPDPRHTSIEGLIAHLTANDAMLAADAELAVSRPVGGREGWRAQADVLVAGLSTVVPDRPVRLAGKGVDLPFAPLRDAVVQRTFETWIHLDDVAAATGRPMLPPSPAQVRNIADLVARLLPKAMTMSGVVHLVLHGPGGGEWRVDAGDGPETTISADAVEFCRLAANRVRPEALRHTVHGDRELARAALRTTATLGCD